VNFSLVSTVFNEINRLDQTIIDLQGQSIQPTEFVIIDAGSNDGTYERLQKWKSESQFPIIILQEKGCNIARGRNIAIQAASNEIIVSTDFGCRFHPDWLSSIISQFEDQSVNLVGGTYTVIEDQIVSISAKANYLLTNAYKLDPSVWFIPSSRSIAFQKEVWKAVDSYPEWLSLAGDDLVFGMKLKAKGFIWKIVDKPYVYWLRYNSFSGYNKESFRYGLGDGEAGVNIRNSIVLFLESSLRLMFLVSIVFLVFGFIWSILFLLLSCFGFRSYLSAFRNWMKLRSGKYNFGTFVYSLVLLEFNRIYYLKGYFKGFFTDNEIINSERKKLRVFLNKPKA